MDYVPPEPGSPRWNRLSGVFHRLKYMQSSDAILFLDKFAEEERVQNEYNSSIIELERKI